MQPIGLGLSLYLSLKSINIHLGEDKSLKIIKFIKCYFYYHFALSQYLEGIYLHVCGYVPSIETAL